MGVMIAPVLGSGSTPACIAFVPNFMLSGLGINGLVQVNKSIFQGLNESGCSLQVSVRHNISLVVLQSTYT